MAAAVYPKFKEARLNGNAVLGTADVRMIAVRGVSFNATHTFVGDLISAGGTDVARTATLTGKTYTLGTFDHDNTTFGVVGTSQPLSGVAWFIHTGNNATARLVCFDDAPGGITNPPNGTEITYTPPVDGVFGPTS